MKISCARKLLVMVLTGLILIGCSDQEAETNQTVRDVEWFKNHKSELEATLKECANNPGVLQQNPNCQNAIAASMQTSSGSLR